MKTLTTATANAFGVDISLIDVEKMRRLDVKEQLRYARRKMKEALTWDINCRRETERVHVSEAEVASFHSRMRHRQHARPLVVGI